MKAVLFAGGFGTRLSEATNLIPKPMVEIGGKPILWHIMKIYSHYGINEFVICCGYKQYVIKEYFAKGLSGGRISILPPIRSNFSAEDNIIAGNTGRYSAAR